MNEEKQKPEIRKGGQLGDIFHRLPVTILHQPNRHNNDCWCVIEHAEMEPKEAGVRTFVP